MTMVRGLSRSQWCCALLLSIALLLNVASIRATEELEEVDVDPDVGLDAVGIAEARGYEVEAHTVTTSDRYVLTMHRLPKSYEETQSGADAAADKPVVVLMHGLIDSSFAWVCNFRNQSLAFLLADAGYDVWLGNNRGNTYSDKHLDYTTDDDEFWDFSWEDMGLYDMPAMINYVLDTSGQSTLSYVGHSEGTMQAFVGFSNDQELAQKVSYFGALAPVAWVGHNTVETLTALANLHVDNILLALGVGDFLSQNEFLQEFLAAYACTLDGALCGTAVALVAGESDNLNSTRMSVYISQIPAGTSVKNMAHFAQGIREDTFSSYDYGCSCLQALGIGLCSKHICGNKEHYGSFDAPAFDLSTMVYPRTGFYAGASDELATSTDIAQLRAALPSDTLVHDQEIDEFGHLDFTWAYNANDKLYQDLMAQIEEYQGMTY